MKSTELKWLSEYLYDSDTPQKIQKILQSHHTQEKTLKTIYLYVTFACNQRCQYCWIYNNVENAEKQLTLDEIRETFDEAIDLGLERVKITGGEPLTNSHLKDIINHLSGLGIAVDLETNATLLNTDWLEKITNPHKVNFKISLDSAQSITHNALADTDQDVFTQTLDGIKSLKKYGATFDIVTVVNRLNINQLDETVLFVSDLKPLSHRLILSIQPLGHGKTAKDLQLTLEETIDVINLVYDLKMKYPHLALGTLHSTLPPAFIPLEDFHFQSCNWGIGLCGIMPNGDVSICAPAFDSLGIIAGNIFENSLSSIWNESELFVELNKVKELEGICNRCSFFSLCRGMCRIFAKAEYGSITSSYPFCQKMYEAGLFPSYAIAETRR